MAVNKDPFVRSRSKDGLPSVFKGLVYTGVAIKIGEICDWNSNAGYFTPISAVADHRYPLAIAKEEMKTTGRGELTGTRYIDFYSLAPEDEFEFELAAAAGIALGDPYTLTASNSQKLTAGVGAFAVAICVDDGHYPQEEDTTIRTVTHGIFSFNPAATWWGYRMNQSMRPGRRVIELADDGTLAANDMYNTLILMTGSDKTATLAAVQPGMDFIVMSTDANEKRVDPNASDQIRLLGAQLTAGNEIDSASTAGDMVHLITESADGFVIINMQGTWSDGGSS